MDNDGIILLANLATNMINLLLRDMADVDVDSDEEMDQTVLEKIDCYVENTIPRFNDRQFKEHFRMLPGTFEKLLCYIHNSDDEMHLIRRGKPEMSLEKQVLITLWCLANVECFRSVADRFGISKRCSWANFYKTASRLLKANQKYKIIAFPSWEKALQTINNFEAINGFPGIIGAIDRCHIRIEKPVEYPNSYINRKGYPSILLQGICDSNKLFLDVYAGEPGSIHDARLFTKSDVSQRLATGEIDFPNDSYLIGDLAYKLSTKLIVGFKDNGHLTEAQKQFNYKLSQSRVVIENTFGILKKRFRRLKMMKTKRLDLICLLTVATCILHNVCLLNNDHWYEVDDDLPERDNDIVNNDGEINNAAVIKRNNIVNLLYIPEYE